MPFGYLSLKGDGTVGEYTPFGGNRLLKREAALGKNFFRELLPSVDVERLERQFKDFVDGSNEAPFFAANVSLAGGQRRQRARVGFVRSPMKDAVIVTVCAVTHGDLPMSARVRPDPLHGTLTDAAGRSVVVANQDFWRSLELVVSEAFEPGCEKLLHRVGMRWGIAHAVRVESVVQRETSRTLSELQIQIALEYLSGSLSVLGLGHFEADLGFRQQGVVVINHRSSPFPALGAGAEGCCCHLLGGFHAGLFSYLSGRNLKACELSCSLQPENSVCRFVVGTEKRLQSLTGPEIYPADRDLVRRLEESGGEDGPR